VEEVSQLRLHSAASARSSERSSTLKRERDEQREKAVPSVRFSPFSTLTVIINSPNCQNTMPSKRKGGGAGKGTAIP
jgi:hypothetical protein